MRPDLGVAVDSRSYQGLAQVLAEFAHALGTDFSIPKILDHLVRGVVDILLVTGAGVMVMVMVMGEGQELHFVASSNEVVMRIEGLQNELGEGPCLQAYRTGVASR
jgi:hypothetical protein